MEVSIGTQQDRDRVRPVTPLIDRGLDISRNRIRLLGDVAGRQHTDRAPLAPGGLESFIQPLRVQCDQPPGSPQDRAATPKVLFEPNHGGIRKHRSEPAQVGNRGAAKLVDALVIVAHHAQVFCWSSDQLEEPALTEVCVLKFVDHQVGKTPGLSRRDRGLADQELNRVVDGVVEIETLLRHQSPLVVAVDQRGFTLGGDHRVIDVRHAASPGYELVR